MDVDETKQPARAFNDVEWAFQGGFGHFPMLRRNPAVSSGQYSGGFDYQYHGGDFGLSVASDIIDPQII